VINQGLTKGVIFIPCKKTFTAMDTANSYINDVYKQFGLPTTLISDRGPQFTSKVFEEIHKIFGINHRKSTTFHPQTNGESEWLNQELETYLRIYCTDHPKQWKDHLPLAEFAHNQRPHQSHQENCQNSDDLW
jgi:transposase InsO family protein